MSLITYGDTGVVDCLGNPISVGDEMMMWRPNRLDKCVIVKYNPKSKMMGVEVLRPVNGTWERSRFSTPFWPNKFYSIRDVERKP